jgi:tRNA pseudouridine55 synthase
MADDTTADTAPLPEPQQPRAKRSQQARPARPRVPVHGVLLLDKPVGLSSNDALIRAKRMLNAPKAGHTGTLDPFATGLLPLCFGEATKFSQDLLEADKTYEALVHLGVRTTPATPKARSSASAPSRSRWRRSKPCWRSSVARSARCRRCTRP